MTLFGRKFHFHVGLLKPLFMSVRPEKILIADDEPPVITGGFHDNANLSKASHIIFIPKDNNDDIKSFKAELDGEWLMFTNDKGRLFIYKFDEKCGRGKHELKITVEDEAGNTTEKIYHFTR